MLIDFQTPVPNRIGRVLGEFIPDAIQMFVSKIRFRFFEKSSSAIDAIQPAN